jgi:hypothetical protein
MPGLRRPIAEQLSANRGRIVWVFLSLAGCWNVFEHRQELGNAIKRNQRRKRRHNSSHRYCRNFRALAVCTFAFINCFRKIRRKGYRVRIAILVTIASLLFGFFGVGLGVTWWSDDPHSAASALDSIFIAGAVSSVGLFVGIAALLPSRTVRFVGERSAWRGDRTLSYRLAAFFFSAVVALLLWRPNLDSSSFLLILTWFGFLGGTCFVLAHSLAKRAVAARYLKPS